MANPVEANIVTRFLLGLAVILAMFFGGLVGGWVFARTPVPFATVLGVFLGALAVFLLFAIRYARYHRRTG